jgi:hypothetical protein
MAHARPRATPRAGRLLLDEKLHGKKRSKKPVVDLVERKPIHIHFRTMNMV